MYNELILLGWATFSLSQVKINTTRKKQNKELGKLFIDFSLFMREDTYSIIAITPPRKTRIRDKKTQNMPRLHNKRALKNLNPTRMRDRKKGCLFEKIKIKKKRKNPTLIFSIKT